MMKKKALVFFSSLLRQNKQAGNRVKSEGLYKVNKGEKSADQILSRTTKKSLGEIVFHNSAKRRLKQYRSNLPK